MTKETTTINDDLEDAAISLFVEANADNETGPSWSELHDDEKAFWIDRAEKEQTAPSARRVFKTARGLNLKVLPTYAIEAIEATGIDPRTHHKKEHVAFDREWNQLVKELRLLLKPSPEDTEIRRELKERGFTPFSTTPAASSSGEIVMEFVAK